MLGSNRPTLVIQRYKELFSQGRLEALDAMESVVQELAAQRGKKAEAKMASEEFRISVTLDILKVRILKIGPL